MAGLKSPARKKRDATKPNTILIVFLVFFILVSIGLGVWGYYGYAGQEKLEKSAKDANLNAKVAKDFAEYNQYMANETRVAIGAAGNPKDAVIDPTDLEPFSRVRAEVLKDNSTFQKERTLEPFKKHLEAFKADLGPFDESTKKYPTSYREKFSQLSTDLKNAQTLLSTKQDDLDATLKKFQDLQTQQVNSWKNALAEIKNGNTLSLEAANKLTKEMANQFDLNKKLNMDIEDLNKKGEAEITNLKRELNIVTAKLLKASADKTDVVGSLGNVARGSESQMHALLLDISRGKPLWDAPLGKITRVDLQARQVYINLGSGNGVKPETTFNIFGANAGGRADKQLKGTIEVIRILDANSSLARITSLFDVEGQEIALGDARSGRASREAENALKEGDLLFNTFWGARVAIAGNIQFAGQASDNPAEQMRILDSFVYFLGRNGITVDAYLDLNDGQVKGAITSRTRYLIRGDDLIDPTQIGVRKKEVKLAEEDDKQEALKEAVPTDRLKTINDAAAKMRQEAADKGLFIISNDNFLNVIGYRQPRSAAFGDPTGFRPRPIVAGPAGQNLPIQEGLTPKMEDKGP